MAGDGEDGGHPEGDIDPADARGGQPAAGPQALYRFFDLTGALLYVGITEHLSRRLYKHRRQQPWWDEVARIDIERHPDRASVEAAEVRAIRTERPRYNVAHAAVAPPKPIQASVAKRSVSPIALELALAGGQLDLDACTAERLCEIAEWVLRDSRDDLRYAVLELRRRGHTFAQQAARMGVSEATVSRWAKERAPRLTA